MSTCIYSSSCVLRALAISFLILPAFSASVASNATCYFPNGSVHKLGTPCRPAAGDGACCESTHACLSNGLCLDVQNNHVVRLSCTDKTWANSNCPNFCNSFASGAISDLRQCDNSNANWVCGQNVTVCSDSKTTKFSVPFGLISDARSNLTQAFVQTAAVTGSSSSATETTTIYATVTAGATSAASDLKATATNTGAQAAIGAGVGVPLLLALLGAVFLYLRERKLRRELMAQGAAFTAPPLPPPTSQVYNGNVNGNGNGNGNGNVYTPAPEYNNTYNPPVPMKTDVYQSNVYERPQTHELTGERRAELS